MVILYVFPFTRGLRGLMTHTLTTCAPHSGSPGRDGPPTPLGKQCHPEASAGDAQSLHRAAQHSAGEAFI